jgi:hypothetical protein
VILSDNKGICQRGLVMLPSSTLVGSLVNWLLSPNLAVWNDFA